MHTITFQTFFVWAFKIVVDSWKFTMLLLYILWGDWSIFMILGSNQQLQQQLEYALLKPDCHNWWISKMQSDTLEEWYAIKFCFKRGKMPQNRMECFRLLIDHLTWIEHQFLSSMRDSRKPGSLWGMIKSMGGVKKSIHQSWLVKRLGLGLLCCGFKGVQVEIPSEEASTLQIGPVAFPPGQCTSQSLSQTIVWPCLSLSQTIVWPRWASRQFLSLPIVQTLLPVTFSYSLSLQAVVMWQLRKGCDEVHWHAYSRRLPWGLAEVVGTVQQVHCSRRRLLGRGLEFHVCTINKNAHTKKSGNLFNDLRIYICLIK